MRLEVEKQIAEAQITGRVSDVLPFKEAWDIYYAALSVHKKHSSIKTEDCAWRLFSAWCETRGIMTVQSLKVGDITQWQAVLLAAGRAPAGVNNRLRMCKTVLNHLIRLQALDGINPFSRVKALKEDNKVNFLPWEKVLEFIRNERGGMFDPRIVDLFFENLDEIEAIRYRLSDETAARREQDITGKVVCPLREKEEGGGKD